MWEITDVSCSRKRLTEYQADNFKQGQYNKLTAACSEHGRGALLGLKVPLKEKTIDLSNLRPKYPKVA